MTQDSHDEKRRKHMAMMGAVKPLEWVKHPNASMWRCDTVVGLYQVAAIAQPATWTFDGLPGQTASGEADDEHEAKAAAQADYSARILSALSIPTDATAALQARVRELESVFSHLYGQAVWLRGDQAYRDFARAFIKRMGALRIKCVSRQELAKIEGKTE